MSLIGKAFLDELRSRLKLSDIIGQRISVSRKGREFQACCPFHNEKTPSFTINDDKEFYHCFGCGAHGDHIGFVMRHDNLPFMEAIEVLAAQAGMQVPKPTPQDRERYDRQDLYYKMMEDACKFFTSQLFAPKHKAVLGYVHGRGLLDDTISSFRLGFAPNDGNALRQYLKGKGYTDNDMRILCLTKQSTRGTEDYDFFRDRLMFPVMDKKGRVVAFGGRVLPDEISPPNPNSSFTPPKYMNSGETPLFHKGHLVYNISNARAAALDRQNVVVSEGYADVIALVQAGFRGAVAPLGTALTETQISLLWDMMPASDEADSLREPILCFDGDSAGQRAAVRAMERVLPILRPGVSVRFAFMPEGQDPDDLIKSKGRDAMAAVLDGAISLYDMVWRHLTKGRDFSRPEQRATLMDAIEKYVVQIADRNIQQSYRQMLRDKTYQSFRSGRSQSGFTQRKNGARGAVPVSITRPQLNKDLPYRLILGIIVQYPQLYDAYEERLARLNIANQPLDVIRQNVISILSDTDGITHEKLIEALDEKGTQRGEIASLNKDIKLHASYVLNKDAFDLVETGLRELLDRVAV